MSEQILTRIKSISIGVDVNNSYPWTGIRIAKWHDVTPWVHIEIPKGYMKHHHIHSPHVEGEIICYDLASMIVALYQTEIDADGNFAVEPLEDEKRPVTYFLFNVTAQDGTAITFQLLDFRVSTIINEGIEVGKEAAFVVKFTADLIIPSIVDD